jgi:hypothetical protein
VVLAIDPGTAKCGIAVARRPAPEAERPHVLHREVAETERLVARVLSLLAAHPEVGAVLIGNATRGPVLFRALRDSLPPGLPLRSVEEAFTSQRARERYKLENPPRGLQKLVPPGMRTPPRPYDDYVALLLAEDYFAATAPPPDEWAR